MTKFFSPNISWNHLLIMYRVSCSNYSYSNYSNILRYSNREYFCPNIRTIRIVKKLPFWAKYHVFFREMDWNSINIHTKFGISSIRNYMFRDIIFNPFNQWRSNRYIFAIYDAFWSEGTMPNVQIQYVLTFDGFETNIFHEIKFDPKNSYSI